MSESARLDPATILRHELDGDFAPDFDQWDGAVGPAAAQTNPPPTPAPVELCRDGPWLVLMFVAATGLWACAVWQLADAVFAMPISK